MLSFSTKPPQARWIAVAGGQILFQPVGPAAMMKGRQAAAAVLQDTGDPQKASEVLTIAVAQACASDWKGVVDEATGKPVAFSSEHLQLLLQQSVQAFDDVDQKLVLPAVRRDLEKNGSSPSHNGISGAKTRARTTAATATPKAARPAPTGSTNRKRRKAG